MSSLSVQAVRDKVVWKFGSFNWELLKYFFVFRPVLIQVLISRQQTSETWTRSRSSWRRLSSATHCGLTSAMKRFWTSLRCSLIARVITVSRITTIQINIYLLTYSLTNSLIGVLSILQWMGFTFWGARPGGWKSPVGSRSKAPAGDLGWGTKEAEMWN